MPKKLVLCDDEPCIVKAAEFKLKRAGYDVRIAFDGEAAWELMQEELPDMLVTDYQMPRLDGIRLVERVRLYESTHKLPVILLTAKGLELDHEAVIKKLRLEALLTKPFSPRDLQTRIEAVIGPAVSGNASLALEVGAEA